MIRRVDRPKGDFFIDRQLHIQTTGIEEWDENVFDYYRFESTPYRALDALFEAYKPESNAYLLDYGAGLGRINLYFYHRFGIPGYGLEIHGERCQKAEKNWLSYAAAFSESALNPPLRFIQEAAETHLPAPETNLFYFFNPFSIDIFEATIARILDALETNDRQADIILYYPHVYYLGYLLNVPCFESYLYVDLPYSKDPRDCFWVFRHTI